MATFAAIITAAGKSTRFGDKNYKKPFAMLGGRAVWLHSIDRFQNHRGVKQTIITVAPEDREDFDRKRGEHDRERAERNAEKAEDDAVFAIRYAEAAIDEAEYAVLDAALTRAEADELAATSE
jgi:2-C-methyl-D-erythritol 4-phosphate cytidylyltransferase